MKSEDGLEMTAEQFRAIGYQAIDMIADQLDRLQNRLEPSGFARRRGFATGLAQIC